METGNVQRFALKGYAVGSFGTFVVYRWDGGFRRDGFPWAGLGSILRGCCLALGRASSSKPRCCEE